MTAPPIGIQYCNPLNIRLTHPPTAWVGALPPAAGDAFVHFQTMAHGIRAAAKIHKSYHDAGACTVAAIIGRWAPPADHNDTEGYIRSVCVSMSRRLGRVIAPDDPIDVRDPDLEGALICAQAQIEVGSIPFGHAELVTGLSMAGLPIVMPAVHAGA
jgi:hypothetical protein